MYASSRPESDPRHLASSQDSGSTRLNLCAGRPLLVSPINRSPFEFMFRLCRKVNSSARCPMLSKPSLTLSVFIFTIQMASSSPSATMRYFCSESWEKAVQYGSTLPCTYWVDILTSRMHISIIMIFQPHLKISCQSYIIYIANKYLNYRIY